MNDVKKAEKKQKGASLVEYALLVALIAVVAIAALKTFGNRASQQFSKTASAMS